LHNLKYPKSVRCDNVLASNRVANIHCSHRYFADAKWVRSLEQSQLAAHLDLAEQLLRIAQVHNRCEYIQSKKLQHWDCIVPAHTVARTLRSHWCLSSWIADNVLGGSQL